MAQGGCQPVALAGHSLGEYSALPAAGALAFTDAVRLVAERARLMQSAVAEGEGATAILGLDDEQIIAACREAAQGEVVEAVNFNSPAQVVIAGQAAAVDRAIAVANTMGAKKAIKLSVSVPSHCALMQPAASQLAAQLSAAQWQANATPVLHNVDAQARQTTADTVTALEQQLSPSALGAETIQQLKRLIMLKRLLNLVQAKCLAGLNKRIERRMPAVCIYDSATLAEALKLCEEGV